MYNLGIPNRNHRSAVEGDISVRSTFQRQASEGVRQPAHTKMDNDGNVIHRDAIVYPGAVLGRNNVIHAGAIIFPGVRMKDDNSVFPYAVIGAPPQNCNEAHVQDGACEFGSGNVIREHVTINSGGSIGATVFGDENLVMAGSHVAHHCVIRNSVTICNNSSLAGHVNVDDGAIIGANTLLYQRTIVGSHSFLLPNALLRKNLLPFHIFGNSPELDTERVNIVAVRRMGGKIRHLSLVKELATSPNFDIECRDRISCLILRSYNSYFEHC